MCNLQMMKATNSSCPLTHSPKGGQPPPPPPPLKKDIFINRRAANNFTLLRGHVAQRKNVVRLNQGRIALRRL